MDIWTTDLNLLKVLDALLRLRNVSRAAEELGLSQPAVSYALQKLRALFNDPLFIRAPHGLRPTQRAEQLAAPVHSALEQIAAEILQQVRFDPARSERTFTLSTSDIGELIMVTTLVQHFAKVAPLARLKTVAIPMAQVTDALEAGEVDLAIGFYPDLEPRHIYQQRLRSRNEIACIVSKQHPFIKRRLSLKQYAQARHVAVQYPGRVKESYDEVLQRLGVKRDVWVTVAHFMTAPGLIAATDLVATVPWGLARRLAPLAPVNVFPAPFELELGEIKQYWHARYHRDPANLWFRQTVYELFADTKVR